MKRYAILIALALVMWVAVAELFQPGLAGELTSGGILKGAVVISTNASQTASVKAVYDFPIYGSVTETNVTTHTFSVSYAKVETLTNFCDYATASAVTNIAGGVTNVVYYDGITVVTNTAFRPVTRYLTNTITRAAVVGMKSVTNSLYSLTASSGYGSSSDKKLIGAGGKILVESAPVTLFWE